ncbi:MAG: (d)CMP kinase [Ruminococcaceae bacterium]|nr:(d)CMP kinase [Oscillospiraceae bacterium]
MTNQIYSVAIDGPAGAGKSTIARQAAKALGFVYVDTGAIYRTIAYAAILSKVDVKDAQMVEALLPQVQITMDWLDGVQQMYLAQENVTGEIRTSEVSSTASIVAAIPAVRQFLLDMQRDVARKRSVIMDGRDIGTVVLPDAAVKIYLFASVEVRAKRRWLEMQHVPFETVLMDVAARDERDMNREIAPLKPAQDAVMLDTSKLDLQQSIDAVVEIIRKKIAL